MSNDININSEYRQARLEKMYKISDLGYDIRPSSFDKTHKINTIYQKYKDLEAGIKTEYEVKVAGRIMSIRNNGMFIDLHDDSGKIQIFSHKNNLEEKQIELLNYLDLGDFIGIEGKVRCTPRGELTIDSYEITFLTKALHTLPEKYHGLSDVETRYRQRYVDLIINQESKDVLLKRSKIISLMRMFFENEGYMEVETPMLHPIAGGAIAKPFKTYHNSLGINLFLRVAPELYLKKLLIGGLSEKIFEINRCFRNEGISTRHNPEFTSVEIYHAYVDHEHMMNLTENLVCHLVKSLYQTTCIKFGDKEIEFKAPWPKKSIADLLKQETGIDFINDIKTDEEARNIAKKFGIQIKPSDGWGKVLEAIFAEKVEHKLIQPIHVTGLPTEISPLAKLSKDDPRITDRFETYVNGWELANGFSELNDPIDQYERFKHQSSLKKAGDEEAFDVDYDFINSLEYGMPPTGGLGIGIDRLVMLLTNSFSIREVIAFPTLRPKN